MLDVDYIRMTLNEMPNAYNRRDNIRKTTHPTSI